VSEEGNIGGNASWKMTADRIHRVSQETLEIERDAKVLLEGDTAGVCVRCM